MKVGVVTSGCPSPSLGKVIVDDDDNDDDDDDDDDDHHYYDDTDDDNVSGRQCVNGVCGKGFGQSRHRVDPSGKNKEKTFKKLNIFNKIKQKY